jgi:hypothetical protein
MAWGDILRWCVENVPGEFPYASGHPFQKSRKSFRMFAGEGGPELTSVFIMSADTC